MVRLPEGRTPQCRKVYNLPLSIAADACAGLSCGGFAYVLNWPFLERILPYPLRKDEGVPKGGKARTQMAPENAAPALFREDVVVRGPDVPARES